MINRSLTTRSVVVTSLIKIIVTELECIQIDINAIKNNIVVRGYCDQ